MLKRQTGSLNFKLLTIVLIAITTLSAALIFAGARASLNQFHAHHQSSQKVITDLISGSVAGNIKFSKTDKLETEFSKFLNDETMNIANIIAVKRDGQTIFSLGAESTFGELSSEIAQEAVQEGIVKTLHQNDKFVVASPAYFGKNNAIVGALVIIWDLNPGLAAVNWSMIETSVIACLISVATMLVISFTLRRVVSQPIRQLTQSATRIAEGELAVEIHGTQRKDELGELAHSIEIFRKNAADIASFEAEREKTQLANRAERAEMMEKLQKAFGEAIDAASEGDFSVRVDCNFSDKELNTLANGLNALIETVERGLSETGETLSAIANTDLTRKVEGSYSGAFEQLKEDTNALADKFCEIVGQLKISSFGLKMATDEIHSGSIDLSNRTTQQAAEIEDASGSMKMISTAISDNAMQAEKAASIVDQVSQNAQKGASVMTDVQSAMTRINQSSNKIADIIGLIDNVAFQTNLLALNASVEAARAGESGKGFAVVAEEVRRLAQTAATASADVSALINESTVEVKSGNELVVDAAKCIDEMVGAAEQNSRIMSSIAKDCRDQATVIEEVEATVDRLDKMTQSNAQLVEETNSSITRTKTEAETLDKIVELFKVEENETPSARTEEMIKEIENDLRAEQGPQAPTDLTVHPNPIEPKAPDSPKIETAVNQDWSEF